MFIWNKKSKILVAAAGFAALVALGLILEAAERDAFIVEPVAEEDKIEYEETGDMITDGKININKADVDALSGLYGIDEGLGERIVQYRREHGRFETIEEIMKVPGIGSGRYESIKDRITVE